MPGLDIHTAVQTAIVLAILATVISVWLGIRAIRGGRKLKFFRMRRDRMVRGWRLLFFAAAMSLTTVLMNFWAEPLIYSIYPPTATLTTTPTITLTPTITTSPTITLTPTVTPTPSVSDTPTVTPTPHVPLAIEVLFESTITPNPEAVFSPMEFAQALDDNYNPVNPNTVFQNPVGHMYARFSYINMLPGVQWTALWMREGELVHYETMPWDGGAGGYGYTDWFPEPQHWLPGDYIVQIFVGTEFKVASGFTVEGAPPTPMPSATPTPTQTGTPTPTGTRTATPTPSLTPTRTPTATLLPGGTAQPTSTRAVAPTPTSGRLPTATERPTSTHAPTPTRTQFIPPATRAPTFTPSVPPPTNTRAPTATPRP